MVFFRVIFLKPRTPVTCQWTKLSNVPHFNFSLVCITYFTRAGWLLLPPFSFCNYNAVSLSDCIASNDRITVNNEQGHRKPSVRIAGVPAKIWTPSKYKSEVAPCSVWEQKEIFVSILTWTGCWEPVKMFLLNSPHLRHAEVPGSRLSCYGANLVTM
jgi:hypothetical protein